MGSDLWSQCLGTSNGPPTCLLGSGRVVLKYRVMGVMRQDGSLYSPESLFGPEKLLVESIAHSEWGLIC